MTLTEFLNALRILRCIDRGVLIDAGLDLSGLEWRDFRDAPYKWLCLASGHDGELVWSIVQRRMPKQKEQDDGKG